MSAAVQGELAVGRPQATLERGAPTPLEQHLRWYAQTHERVDRDAFVADLPHVVRRVIEDSPRVAGHLFTWAKQNGILEDDGRTVRSKAPGARGRKIVLWRSLLYPGASRPTSPVPADLAASMAVMDDLAVPPDA